MVQDKQLSSLNEIINRRLVHQNNDVVITLKRNPWGERIITCTSPKNPRARPLYMSVLSLIGVFDGVSMWKRAKYKPCDTSVDRYINVYEDIQSHAYKLKLTFSLHQSVPSVDVRLWWEPRPEVGFFPTVTRFQIQNVENIDLFLKMEEELEIYNRELDLLDRAIQIAYEIVYEVGNERSDGPFNVAKTNVLSLIDFEKFAVLWNEKVKNVKNFDSPVDSKELYNYITNDTLKHLEDYIDDMCFFRDPMKYILSKSKLKTNSFI